MQGLLTYSGIFATVLVSLFGNYLAKDEAESIAVAVLTLISAGVAVYGRLRIKSAKY